MTRRDAGFTLVEMMVVMAIVALSVVMILPVSRRSAETRELAATGQALAAALRQARIAAISKNAETALRVDLERRAARIDGEARDIVIPGSIAIRLVTAHGDVAAKDAAFRFFPDGGATGGEINLERGGTNVRVAVNWLTGAVSVETSGPP